MHPDMRGEEHELPAQGAEPRLEPEDLDKGPKVRNIVAHHLYGDQLGGSLAETPHEHAQLVGQACYWSVGESRSWQPKATCHGATLFRQSAAGTRGCSGRVPCDHRRSACLPLLAPPHCTTMRLGPVRGCTASLRPPAHRLLRARLCAPASDGVAVSQAQLGNSGKRKFYTALVPDMRRALGLLLRRGPRLCHGSNGARSELFY